jgi:hypothetical protein
MMLLSKTGKSIVEKNEIRPICMISALRKACELLWLKVNETDLWRCIGEYQ